MRGCRVKAPVVAADGKSFVYFLDCKLIFAIMVLFAD